MRRIQLRRLTWFERAMQDLHEWFATRSEDDLIAWSFLGVVFVWLVWFVVYEV